MVDEPFEGGDSYNITEADNSLTEYYGTFAEAEEKYPQLKGLKDVLQYEPPTEDDIDVKVAELTNKKLKAFYELDQPMPGFPYLNKQKAMDILKGKDLLYSYNPTLRNSSTPNNYIYFGKNKEAIESKLEINRQQLKLLDKIPYEILPITNDIKEYLLDFIELANKYDKQIAKAKLQSLNEGANSQSNTIKQFIKFAIKELGIQKPPTGITLSRDNEAARSMHTFGSFNPNNDKIWLYVKNRNMADLLRTLAHELVHRKQAEDGRIDYNSGETGSDIENEANAQAGVLLRKFGKQNEEIYQ